MEDVEYSSLNGDFTVVGSMISGNVNAKVKVGHHSAYTKINPKWRWWKPWIQRFISVPEGYNMIFRIGNDIEIPEKPSWSS